MLSIILPAAGLSSRMQGADKLLEDVDGQPCIAVMTQRALKVSQDVIVTIPDAAHLRAQAIADLGARVIVTPDATSGMSASLRTGIAAIDGNSTAAMILLPDMPNITANDLATLWAVFQASGVSVLQAATQSGTPGHPVIFARSLFSKFAKLIGDTGAKSVIQAAKTSHALLPLADDRATLDLDTPQAWAAWRKHQQ